MNIAQLIIAGSAKGQPPAHAEGAGLKGSPSDFEALLTNMISDALNGRPGEGSGEGPTALAEAPLSVFVHPKMDEGQLLALIQEKGDAFTMLGEQLQALLSSLLNGDAIESQVESFGNALNDTISGFGQSSEENKGEPFLLNILLKLKEMVRDGTLKGKVEDSAQGLPESLKLKLKLHLRGTGRADTIADNPEVGVLHFKLIAHVMSNVMGRADEMPAGSLENSAKSPTHGVINMHAHITAAMDVIDTAVVAEPVAEDQNQTAIETTGDFVGADEDLPVDGLESVIASYRAAEEPQSALDDLLTADVEDVKPAGVEALRGGEASKAQNDGDTTALADDAVSAKVVGSEIEGGRSEADTSHDQKGETRVHTADASADRGAGASKKDFVQHLSTHAQSAKANAADPYGVTKQIADRFVEKFDILLSGNKSEARIQLHPRHLGELKIHLFVEHGSMRALLDASSHQVKEILEANLQGLKQSLENQGIQVSRFDVSVGQQGERGQGFSRNRFGKSSVGGFENIAEEAKRIKASLRIDGNLAVDVLV